MSISFDGIDIPQMSPSCIYIYIYIYYESKKRHLGKFLKIKLLILDSFSFTQILKVIYFMTVYISRLKRNAKEMISDVNET